MLRGYLSGQGPASRWAWPATRRANDTLLTTWPTHGASCAGANKTRFPQPTASLSNLASPIASPQPPPRRPRAQVSCARRWGCTRAPARTSRPSPRTRACAPSRCSCAPSSRRRATRRASGGSPTSVRSSSARGCGGRWGEWRAGDLRVPWCARTLCHTARCCLLPSPSPVQSESPGVALE